MQADLLHLIASARGITTRDLLAEIKTSRRMGIWPHAEPRNMPELQRLLRVLQGTGQISIQPDGWYLASQVPQVKAGARELPAMLFD